jgi:hypothetical protein
VLLWAARDVFVLKEVAVVVETEVVVRSLAVPTKNPTPARANIVTINREAIIPFLMPLRVASRGVKFYP